MDFMLFKRITNVLQLTEEQLNGVYNISLTCKFTIDRYGCWRVEADKWCILTGYTNLSGKANEANDLLQFRDAFAMVDLLVLNYERTLLTARFMNNELDQAKYLEEMRCLLSRSKK